MPSRAATSTLHDTRTAAHELADRLEAALGPGPPAGLLVVASFHHRAALPEAFELLRGTLRPHAAVAVTTVGVVGEGCLHEGVPAMAALLLDDPGLEAAAVRITPDDGPPATWSDERRTALLGGGLAAGFQTMLWADPFSSDPPGLAAVGAGVLVHGGVLSGSSQAGGNTLIAAASMQAPSISPEGAVGLAFRGVGATAISGPGARPIGPPAIVTAADGSRLLGLGGRPALEVLREALESSGELGSLEDEAPMGGLAIGVAIEEHRPDGHPPICRLRPLTGIVGLRRNGAEGGMPALRLAEPIRPGRTVRFFLRDAAWAAKTFSERLRAHRIDLDAHPAVVVAVSTARELEPTRTDGTGIREHPLPELGGAGGVGLRTAGEFVQLGGRSDLDTLSASTLCFDGPPALGPALG